jgi:peptide/nickel transport system permease protein
VVPGDTATIILGEGASQADIDALRSELGMDRPLVVQYFDWLGGAVLGDFGTSVRTGIPVAEEIGRRLPITIELTILAMTIAISVGVPAGVVSAIRQNRLPDYTVRLFSIGGLSMPDFWVGTLFLLLPLLWWGWAPELRYVSIFENPRANLEHFLLPSLALGISLSALVMRMVRSSMLEVMRMDYVRTARAKGLSSSAVVLRHGLRTALIPVVTILGLQVSRLLGGAVVMEQLFALPGMGRFVLESITQRDFLMLQSVVLVIALFLQVINLLVDLSYAWLDPRVRLD